MAKKVKAQVVHVIIPLVEGETEVEFYKQIRQLLINKHQNPNYDFQKPINMKGIGNYKASAAAKFRYEMNTYLTNIKSQNRKIKSNNTKYVFHAFMCIDTDVLELSANPTRFQMKPPINEKETKESIKKVNGVPHFIKAVHSIEDWFLEDKNGICKYLRLPRMPKLDSNKSGADKLNSIFKKQGKLYTKGEKCEGFIDCLNVDGILQNHIADFQELIDLMK